MNINSKLGNFFSICKVALLMNQPLACIKYSKFNLSIAKILYLEGYINGYFLEKRKNKFIIKIYLKYIQNKSVIRKFFWNKIKYKKQSNLKIDSKLFSLTNYGLVVFSTNQGLKTLDQCFLYKLNGVFLFQII